MKLRAKFCLYVSLVVAFVVLVSSAIHMVAERKIIQSELTDRHEQMIQLMARVSEEALYQSDFVLLNYFEKLKKERGFHSAYYTDAQGMIQIHSDPALVGQTLADLTPDVEHYVHLTAPVHAGGNPAGEAHLLLDRRDIQAFMDQYFIQSLKRIGFVSVVALIVGILGALWVSGTMMKPIRNVISGMRKISQGKLTPIPEPKNKDELGWMSRELNTTISKLKELDEMKRDFVAGVTHELRSPLGAIQSFLAILLKNAKKREDPNDQELILTLQNNTQRLNKMIDDLLTTAKIEAGRLELEIQDLDIRDIIHEVYSLYGPLAREKKISLQLDLPDDPLFVSADPTKMNQVIVNLVSNAFKFTEKGSVIIRAKQHGKSVFISIEDTGRGIPSQERHRIFEKFAQGSGGRQIKKGTGLGLSIVKGLVEAHHGQISVEPNKQHGSRFMISLPKAA
jgi:signal transduction histidine kinase